MPFAGGSAVFYTTLREQLSNNVNIAPIEYSGHGKRHSEPLLIEIDEFGDNVYMQLKRSLEEHVTYDQTLMEYSEGILALVEILKRLIGEGDQSPQCVFLASHAPAKLPTLVANRDLTDEWVRVSDGTLWEVLTAL